VIAHNQWVLIACVHEIGLDVPSLAQPVLAGYVLVTSSRVVSSSEPWGEAF
jgi:hypothetical protein